MVPDEEALESLLANLVICLQTLVELNSSRPNDNGQSPALDSGLRAISNFAREICGECAPNNYTQALKESTDHIQELARKIA